MPSRDPPNTDASTKNHDLVYEFLDDLSAFNAQADGWPGYDESCITPQIKLSLCPSTGLMDGIAIPHLHGDKFLSIPCEKSGNLLHITHPHIILL